MSITVQIDGQPAEQFQSYIEALTTLGPVPDESQQLVEIWTVPPLREATVHSVWLNPSSSVAAAAWISQGGAIIDCIVNSNGSIDHLHQHEIDVRVRSQQRSLLNPTVLACFLAHDFPLIDALMLARAYRAQGWPDDLTNYPIPMAGPYSNAPFAPFPRNAGLYAVAPTTEWVRRLTSVNVPVVQLRDKGTDSARRSAAIREAVQSTNSTRTLLLINDHWEYAIEHGAFGVHLGQEDIETANLEAIRKAGMRLGISTHGIYEMLRAHACKPSYMALGAIYATTTKTMPTAPQGLRRLKHYVQLMSPHYPLVAIGGIDRSRIADIWATGVDCAAVLRAIVDAPDYRRTALELLELTPETVFSIGAS